MSSKMNPPLPFDDWIFGPDRFPFFPQKFPPSNPLRLPTSSALEGWLKRLPTTGGGELGWMPDTPPFRASAEELLRANFGPVGTGLLLGGGIALTLWMMASGDPTTDGPELEEPEGVAERTRRRSRQRTVSLRRLVLSGDLGRARDRYETLNTSLNLLTVEGVLAGRALEAAAGGPPTPSPPRRGYAGGLWLLGKAGGEENPSASPPGPLQPHPPFETPTPPRPGSAEWFEGEVHRTLTSYRPHPSH